MSEMIEAVSGRKEGDKVSNGRHILRGLYQAKREKQLMEAEQRAQARAIRTPGEQFEMLRKRLGLGVGAKKERARLWLQILNMSHPLSKNGKTGTDKQIAETEKDLEIAKMESRGYRIMRKLGLSPRTEAEYEAEKYAAQFAA
jgi:hypothetical protein